MENPTLRRNLHKRPASMTRRRRSDEARLRALDISRPRSTALIASEECA